MTNSRGNYWDSYDPYGFICNWWADAINRLDFRKDVESLRPFRQAESFLPCRVFKMRRFSSATGL